ncbi:uncharacterized protein LOC110441177 [Mizuhopecten yessoensis]|uniref:uncharacterized protein LOC110441177 n=1 Tax=Mizuhopecten yessoensis TaxID=6573 RepID=UPI000B45F607|nr:uncharacterized protein LOC110441177 [Mizuhopecten yessoensis]
MSTVQISPTTVNTSLDSKVTTSQSSDFETDYRSDKAVDGCTKRTLRSGCCSHTNVNPAPNEAWWQIDLGDQVVIEDVKIYYRDEAILEQKGRFAGYQIYLSNTTTDWRNNGSCYTDTPSAPCVVELTPRITSCTGNTRYLTIYVDRRTLAYSWYSTQAFLELCEVQVHGCPVGKYGDGDCDSNCDPTCVNSQCHPNSGQCSYCAPGFYKSGLVCTACPTNCLNGVCNVESGLCSECVPGVYGPNCTQTCPVSCQDKCERNTGECNGIVICFLFD